MKQKINKLLIVGDSFSADWSIKYPSAGGWVNKFFDYEVTNLSQAGASEYKIVLQLNSVDITEYHKVIICHTSPFRIYIKKHPVHHHDTLHNNCDLIYNDVLAHKYDFISNIAVDFFENIYDMEYASYIHKLIVTDLQKQFPAALHISFFDLNISNVHYFDKEFNQYKGNINHLTNEGNDVVYNKIHQLL